MTTVDDSQVILLLCSHLGLPPNPEFPPLTLKEWNSLALKMHTQSIRPGSLLDFRIEDLQQQFMLDEHQTERISHLLQRGGSLGILLERLASAGIFPLTRADDEYPAKYRQRLKDAAPSVLFYAGEKALLGQPGIAVVGSRHLDEAGQACAEFVGNACGWSGQVLYSGGAKGVDSISMDAALGVGGTSVGILATSLDKAVREPEYRQALSKGNLCLATPYSPDAPFTVGGAMGRNKLIYSLADYAIVVASDEEKGGTWSGAVETLKAKWVPVFVLTHDTMPEGNRKLLQKGALSFPHPFEGDFRRLREWFDGQAGEASADPYQPGLF